MDLGFPGDGINIFLELFDESKRLKRGSNLGFYSD